MYIFIHISLTLSSQNNADNWIIDTFYQIQIVIISFSIQY